MLHDYLIYDCYTKLSRYFIRKHCSLGIEFHRGFPAWFIYNFPFQQIILIYWFLHLYITKFHFSRLSQFYRIIDAFVCHVNAHTSLPFFSLFNFQVIKLVRSSTLHLQQYLLFKFISLPSKIAFVVQNFVYQFERKTTVLLLSNDARQY